jgi:small subunit ribosomal protein S18
MSKKIRLKVSSRLLKKKSRKGNFSNKHCRFCVSDAQSNLLDFKNSTFLRSFLTERGKILPSRISGNCAAHQRNLACKIKNARIMALLPYAATNF